MTLDTTVKSLVLSVSAATIDRLLSPFREHATGRECTRPNRKTRAKVNVKTLTTWDDVAPGSLEVDFVAHCGGNLSGAIIQSLVATDVSSGWTGCIPILIREQSLVVETMELLRMQFLISGAIHLAILNEILSSSIFTISKIPTFHPNDFQYSEKCSLAGQKWT